MVSFGPEYSRSSTFQDQMWRSLTRITQESVPYRDSVSTLLDLGCGTGLRTRDCFRVFPKLQQILAIDNDYSMIHEAIRTNKDPRIKFTTLDIMRLNTLISRKFDAITSNWALHWIADKDALFESLNLLSQHKSLMLIGTCERLPTILADFDIEIRKQLNPPSTLPLYYLDKADWVSLVNRYGWTVLGSKTSTETRAVPSDGSYIKEWYAASTGRAFYGKTLEELSPGFLENLKTEIHARYSSPGGESWNFTEDVLLLVLQRETS